MDNPNINTTSLASMMANLTDVQSNREMLAGDLKLIVKAIYALSRDAGGNGSSTSQRVSDVFVKVGLLRGWGWELSDKTKRCDPSNEALDEHFLMVVLVVILKTIHFLANETKTEKFKRNISMTVI